MKILRMEVESCMSCPYLSIEFDMQETIIVCKNRDAVNGDKPFCNRVILRQPMYHVVADIATPIWCPLSDKIPNEGAVRELVFAKIDAIINLTAWRDSYGHCGIKEENFENLQIAVADFLVPLLRKAGWFVDEDDGLLTRCGGITDNEDYQEKKS